MCKARPSPSLAKPVGSARLSWPNSAMAMSKSKRKGDRKGLGWLRNRKSERDLRMGFFGFDLALLAVDSHRGKEERVRVFRSGSGGGKLIGFSWKQREE